jgi:hypothetical protein
MVFYSLPKSGQHCIDIINKSTELYNESKFIEACDLLYDAFHKIIYILYDTRKQMYNVSLTMSSEIPSEADNLLILETLLSSNYGLSFGELIDYAIQCMKGITALCTSSDSLKLFVDIILYNFLIYYRFLQSNDIVTTYHLLIKVFIVEEISFINDKMTIRVRIERAYKTIDEIQHYYESENPKFQYLDKRWECFFELFAKSDI